MPAKLKFVIPPPARASSQAAWRNTGWLITCERGSKISPTSSGFAGVRAASDSSGAASAPNARNPRESATPVIAETASPAARKYGRARGRSAGTEASSRGQAKCA